MSVLPWHQEAFDRLLRRATQDRLPHALVLSGPVGSGKNWFALQLACALIGIQVGSTATPRQPLLPAHPDLRRLQPPEGKRQIPVDAVRELVGFAVSRPQTGAWKLAIVSPADAMNLNSANALLKTLEEPAPGTVLLLLSHRPGGLLPTIRSRCQQVLLPLPEASVAEAWLAEQGSARLPDAASRTRALVAAGGAPLAALDLADANLLDAMGQLEQLLTGPVQVSAAAQALADEAALITSWWYRLLSARLEQVQAGREPGGRANSRLATPPDPAEAHYFLERLVQAKALLDGTSNPNPRLLLESLFIGWNRLLAGRPIDTA